MMKYTRDDLVAAVLKQDKDLTAAQARLTRRIQRFYRNYTGRVEALIRRPEIFPKSEILKLAGAQRVADQMAELLVDAGLDDLIADYLDEFADLRASALDYFEVIGANRKLSGASRESLTGFVKFTEETLRESVNARLLSPLQEGIFQSVFAGASRENVINDLLARSTSLRPNQIEVLVHDSFAQYQRTVTNGKAAELDLAIRLYDGPSDERTSEQCDFLLAIDRHGLPGALYVDEISADLHPALRANPLIAGGHPNCRHVWLPVTLDYAKSLGFKDES